MSNFISWVEHQDEIYFLTDNEVFSPEGIRMLGSCKDSDVLSHDAIRMFFSVEHTAINKKQRAFWNTDTIPEILRALLATPEMFLSVWGRMLEHGVFQADDFYYIARYAPREWKSIFWEQALKTFKHNSHWAYRARRHAQNLSQEELEILE
jgi:hypothetical protein